MQNQRASSDSFDGIQYLRAIAALMVVAHHARHYFGAVPDWSVLGSRGVDIFFVISGFIMAYSTAKFDPTARKAGQALDFWVRRFLRVVPLYWLALLYQNKKAIVFGNAESGLLADFSFLPRFSPTHPGEIYPSLIPGWTINYEIFFYLLFGLAFFFGSRRYLALFIGFVALMTAGALWDFSSAPPAFWTDAILGEFLLGVGVYALYARRKDWVPTPWPLWGALLLGFAGLALENGSWPRLLADGPFAALIVWGGVYCGRLIPPQKMLHTLGDASYSIYLVHTFTFSFSFKVLDLLGMNVAEPVNIALALTVCTLVATLVGIAVHFFVEKPMLRWMSDTWRGWRKDAPDPVRVNKV